jgi:hypothetical protein
MAVSGIYAHPGAEVVLALASSMTPKLFMMGEPAPSTYKSGAVLEAGL